MPVQTESAGGVQGTMQSPEERVPRHCAGHISHLMEERRRDEETKRRVLCGHSKIKTQQIKRKGFFFVFWAHLLPAMAQAEREGATVNCQLKYY